MLEQFFKNVGVAVFGVRVGEAKRFWQIDRNLFNKIMIKYSNIFQKCGRRRFRTLDVLPNVFGKS